MPSEPKIAPNSPIWFFEEFKGFFSTKLANFFAKWLVSTPQTTLGWWKVSFLKSPFYHNSLELLSVSMFLVQKRQKAKHCKPETVGKRKDPRISCLLFIVCLICNCGQNQMISLVLIFHLGFLDVRWDLKISWGFFKGLEVLEATPADLHLETDFPCSAHVR